MARSHAIIYTSIWSDDEFRALDRTSQQVYFMALTQPTLNICGVTLYVPTAWANNAKDLTPRLIDTAIAHLQATDYVHLDRNTSELWIRSLIKHEKVLSKPNAVVSLSRDFPGILSPRIRERLLDLLGDGLPDLLTERFGDGFWERLAEPFRQRFTERFPEPIREPMPPRTRERTPARAESPRQPQPQPQRQSSATASAPNGSGNPSANGSDPEAATPRTDVVLRTEDLTDDDGQAGMLAKRLLEACSSRGEAATVEAFGVVRWALDYVDARVVDEAIGWAEARDKPLKLPRAVASTIRGKADDRGIVMPDYDPRSIVKALA